MDVIRIADPNDPRLSAYFHLADAELLRNRGLFVAEGRLIVERVLTDRRYQVESVLLNPPSHHALRGSVGGARADLVVFECPTSFFEAVTGFNIHRGCLALVRRPSALTWQNATAASQLVVVMEGVTNADNVGSVFRNAAAFGAGAVLLSPTCCDPFYRKAVRTSMGHVLRVPFARVEPWPAVLGDLRRDGFTVAALTPRKSAGTIDQFAQMRRGGRVALMLGTEGGGLTESAERLADLVVRIPMDPDVDSLNIAVASGIALSRMMSTREPGTQSGRI
jgi:tRNA G18 (ribose-2'-O)-methylase SpoU